ncbi:MAG TPA: hypothetical protein VK534_00180 [Methylomirabilota bacterium]|nr:hypothetical protein [Methylomirabilota bacterium]
MAHYNKLSPAKYEALARSHNEAGMRAQNEASYNFEGADPELDFTWESTYERIADLLRERLLNQGKHRPEAAQAGEVKDDRSIEEVKANVINTIETQTEAAPLDLSQESHSLFHKTKSSAKSIEHSSSKRKVTVSNVEEITSFLGVQSGESRKFRVTEYDGTKEDNRTQYEPFALVATHFDIDQQTSQLTVTQEVASAVSPEHTAIFPSLGINQKSSDEQWFRLANVLDS